MTSTIVEILAVVIDPIPLVMLAIGAFATRSAVGVVVAAAMVMALRIGLNGPPLFGLGLVQAAVLVALGFGLRWVRWKLWPPRKA
jgi:hypothetical protein